MPEDTAELVFQQGLGGDQGTLPSLGPDHHWIRHEPQPWSQGLAPTRPDLSPVHTGASGSQISYWQARPGAGAHGPIELCYFWRYRSVLFLEVGTQGILRAFA